jgi:putative oxidoreductase
MITGTMVTAIRKVHASNGPWVTEGGFEYNAVLLGAMAAITEMGPGAPSFDAARLPRFKGTALALLQLAAGIAGSYLVTSPVLNEAAGATSEETADTPGDPAPAPQEADARDREAELAHA